MAEFIIEWGVPALIAYTLAFIALITYVLWKAGKFKDEPSKQEQILAFIQYLNSEIKEEPQCMMMAMILKLKFSHANILYNNNHFITEIEDTCYDWDGVVKRTKNFTEFPAGWGDSHIVNHYFAIAEKFNRNN